MKLIKKWVWKFLIKKGFHRSENGSYILRTKNWTIIRKNHESLPLIPEDQLFSISGNRENLMRIPVKSSPMKVAVTLSEPRGRGDGCACKSYPHRCFMGVYFPENQHKMPLWGDL